MVGYLSEMLASLPGKKSTYCKLEETMAGQLMKEQHASNQNSVEI